MACWNALFDQARAAFAQQRSAERARAWSIRLDLFGPSYLVRLAERHRMEVDAFLKSHGAKLEYTLGDIERDRDANS